MQLISAQTLSSAATGVTFSSIPQTFTDLKVVCSVRNVNTNSYYLYIYLNGSGGTYNYKFLRGTGGTITSGSDTGVSYGQSLGNYGSTTANAFGSAEFYIPNYSGSNQKFFSVDYFLNNLEYKIQQNQRH